MTRIAGLILFLAITASVSLPGFAQVPELTDLQVTNSPGLILLDKSPASIDKPIDPKTFAISLYNLADGGSLECTPYWFFKHPEYTLKKHIENKIPILQTLNLSLSTFKTDSNTDAAIGIRTQIFKKYDQQTIESIKIKVKEIQLEIIEDELDWNKINMLLDALNELKSSMRWNIELVGAATGNYLNNDYQNLSFQKLGVWLNIKYTPKNVDCDVILLARYIFADAITKSNNFDLGTAMYYSKDKFEGNLEYVFRLDAQTSKIYNRLSFMLNYKLSNKLSIVSSFGRNFNAKDNLFTLLGIKFGISGIPVDNSF